MSFNNSKLPKIQEKKISLLKNNDFFKEMKILHLSDLHISRNSKNAQILEFVDMINMENYDFIFCSGDLIDDKIRLIEEKIRLLQKIKSKVYFVSGNHDIFYGYNKLISILNEIGFETIDNRVLELTYKNKKFNLIGLSDRFSIFFGIKRDKSLLLNLINKDIPSILLTHQPKDYKIALNLDVSLMLSGHTHGGQIFPFHLLVKIAQKYLSGIYYNKQLTIFVNKGIGTWGIHKRFLSDAEIPTLVLN